MFTPSVCAPPFIIHVSVLIGQEEKVLTQMGSILWAYEHCSMGGGMLHNPGQKRCWDFTYHESPPTTYMRAHTLKIRLTMKLHQVTRSLVMLLSDCVPRMVIPQKLCPCPARHHPQSAKSYHTSLKFSCCNFQSVFNLYFALYRHSALSLHWSYSSTNPDLFYSMKVGWDWHRNQYPDFLQFFVAI